MASYKVLYRKYRPDSFEKIVGQTSIVQILRESVIENTFSHAYLFTGPRGTGKTSTAKVLAKALNCSSPINGEACNECQQCKNFSTSPDIIEIDAASNNGVNEIRELRNNITLAPSSSKYKIYIIDEVHMLSSGAFNALLKTLEEPPAHAIFILATTEVYKVPITILSRCQRYDFRKIDKAEMINHLKNICSLENIEYEEPALEEIYDLSEGCLRDALSILDQTSKFSSKLTLKSILDSYNIISNNSIKELLDSVLSSNVEKVVTTIEEFENTGMNAQKMIKKIINYMEREAINTKLKKQDKYSFAMLGKLIGELNKCYIDARINENVFSMVKLAFLEAMDNPTPAIDNKTSQLESSNVAEKNQKVVKKKIIEQPPNDNNTQKLNNMSLEDIRINNCFVEVNKESLKKTMDSWETITNKGMPGIELLNYKPVAASPKYAIFTADEDSLAHLFNIKNEDIEKHFVKEQNPIKVVAISANRWQNEKEKYKNNIKTKKKYEYIEEPKKEKGSELKKEMNSLFTEEVVEIS